MKRTVVALLCVMIWAGPVWATSDALVYFSGVGDLEKVRGLVSGLGVDVNRRNSQGNTALAAAANNGHIGVVRFLLEKKADVNARVILGRTALMVAATNGHTDIVKLLIIRGANDTLTDGFGLTALQMARAGGHTATAGFLSRLAISENIQGYLTIYAAQENIKGMRKALAAGARIDDDGPGHNRLTPLMVAVAKSRPKAVLFLIEEGADVNFVNATGSSALHVAIRSGNVEMVKLLIEQGASVQRNKSPKSPIVLAAEQSRPDIVGLLEQRRDKEICMERLLDERVEIEKRLNEHRNRPGAGLTEVERTEVIKSLNRLTEIQDIIRPLCSEADLQSWTIRSCAQLVVARDEATKYEEPSTTRAAARELLMDAAYFAKTKELRESLREGADPKIKNGIDETPLMIAVFAHYLRNGVSFRFLEDHQPMQTIQLLLDAGVDINAPDLRGWTPLMVAAYDGDKDVAALLLKKGADPGITNSAGDTALVLAKKKDQQEVIQLLERHLTAKQRPKAQPAPSKARVEAPDED